MEDGLSLADIARATGSKPRAMQLWAESGVLQARRSTEKRGTGKHRVFDRDEAIIACLLHAVYKVCRLPVGVLLKISGSIRYNLRTEPVFRNWVEESIQGKGDAYITLYSVASKGDAENEDEDVDFNIEFGDFGPGNVEKPLPDGSIMISTMMKPHLARLR